MKQIVDKFNDTRPSFSLPFLRRRDLRRPRATQTILSYRMMARCWPE